MSEINKKKEKTTKDKELKIFVTFNKEGDCFQDIIERILISKIIN